MRSMRRFSDKEKSFIVRNEDELTLEELAMKFKCEPKEVLECYSDIIDTGEHWKYYKVKHDRFMKHFSKMSFKRWGDVVDEQSGTQKEQTARDE